MKVKAAEGKTKDLEAVHKSAIDTFESGQSAKATTELWSHAAVQGSAGAQHNLGMMYHRGKEVPQDEARGLALLDGRWLILAVFAFGFLYKLWQNLRNANDRGKKQDTRLGKAMVTARAAEKGVLLITYDLQSIARV
jgi:TPR repeat protein